MKNYKVNILLNEMQCFCFQDAPNFRPRICKFPGNTLIEPIQTGNVFARYMAQVSIVTNSICCLRQAMASGLNIYDNIPNENDFVNGFINAALLHKSFDIVYYMLNELNYNITKHPYDTDILFISLNKGTLLCIGETKKMYYFLRSHNITCKNPEIMFDIIAKIQSTCDLCSSLRNLYTSKYLMDICPKLEDETDLHRAVRIGDVELVKKILGGSWESIII